MSRCLRGLPARGTMQEQGQSPRAGGSPGLLESTGRGVSLEQSSTRAGFAREGTHQDRQRGPHGEGTIPEGAHPNPAPSAQPRAPGGSRTSRKLAFNPDGKTPALVLGKIYRPVATTHPPSWSGDHRRGLGALTLPAGTRLTFAAAALPSPGTPGTGRNTRGQEHPWAGKFTWKISVQPEAETPTATSPNYILR